MKTLSRYVALAAMLVILASVGVMARDEGGQPGPGGQPGAGGQQGSKGRGGGPVRGILQELNLTAAQQQQIQPMNRAFGDQMKGLQQAFEERMKTILTAEQLARATQMRQQDPQIKQQDLIRQLGLNDQQKQQMKAIREQQRPQMQAAVQGFITQVKTVLTPEQATRFEQLMKERGPGAGGGRHPGGAGAGKQ